MEAKSSQLALSETSPSRPIRLLLDARKLEDGGIGVYLQNLISGLLAIGGTEITLLAPPGMEQKFPRASEVSWLVDPSPCYSIDELFSLGRRIAWQHFDLFHTPHYVLPFSVKVPSVITVHDLIHIRHPEKFFYPWVANRLIRSSVSRASAVLAVSRATRQEVASLTGMPEGRINVVPNAISEHLSTGLLSGAVDLRLADEEPFFLSVFSNLKPHKALGDLLQAYRLLRSEASSPEGMSTFPKLVLAGFGAEEIRRSTSLRRQIERERGVRVLGAVTQGGLAELYSRASALVVPSRAEGFCLPALEAQARGTPVVCRPVPAVQELVTERDVVAADMTVGSLRDAMRGGLAMRTKHGSEPFQAHLRLYAPERVARDVLNVYLHTLGERRGL